MEIKSELSRKREMKEGKRKKKEEETKEQKK